MSGYQCRHPRFETHERSLGPAWTELTRRNQWMSRNPARRIEPWAASRPAPGRLGEAAKSPGCADSGTTENGRGAREPRSEVPARRGSNGANAGHPHETHNPTSRDPPDCQQDRPRDDRNQPRNPSTTSQEVHPDKDRTEQTPDTPTKPTTRQADTRRTASKTDPETTESRHGAQGPQVRKYSPPKIERNNADTSAKSTTRRAETCRTDSKTSPGMRAATEPATPYPNGQISARCPATAPPNGTTSPTQAAQTRATNDETRSAPRSRPPHPGPRPPPRPARPAGRSQTIRLLDASRVHASEF